MSSKAGTTTSAIGYEALIQWLRARGEQDSCITLPKDTPKEAASQEAPSNGMIGVFSSGSTGKAKQVWKEVGALRQACVRSEETQDWTWATCYKPWTFAGVHLACQAALSNGQVLELGQNWPANWDRLRNHQPEALSATPTFLDLLLQSNPNQAPGDWTPKQITLGGEILRPATGQRIMQAFPDSRFTLIYASAELGLLAKTHRPDGWFPVQSLNHRFEDWRIHQDELQYRDKGQWLPTRDLCELKDDHFRIVGRMDRVLNIGSEKVCLDEIETVAEALPEVRRATASAKSNAIVGQVVALKLETDLPNPDQHLLDHIAQSLRKSLPKPAWPRWMDWGEPDPLKNGKKV